MYLYCAESAVKLQSVNQSLFMYCAWLLQALWRLREEITSSLLADGHCYKYDISLPLQDYYKVVEVVRERLKSVTTRVVAYGHVGDGLSS